MFELDKASENVSEVLDRFGIENEFTSNKDSGVAADKPADSGVVPVIVEKKIDDEPPVNPLPDGVKTPEQMAAQKVIDDQKIIDDKIKADEIIANDVQEKADKEKKEAAEKKAKDEADLEFTESTLLSTMLNDFNDFDYKFEDIEVSNLDEFVPVMEEGVLKKLANKDTELYKGYKKEILDDFGLNSDEFLTFQRNRAGFDYDEYKLNSNYVGYADLKVDLSKPDGLDVAKKLISLKYEVVDGMKHETAVKQAERAMERGVESIESDLKDAKLDLKAHAKNKLVDIENTFKEKKNSIIEANRKRSLEISNLLKSGEFDGYSKSDILEFTSIYNAYEDVVLDTGESVKMDGISAKIYKMSHKDRLLYQMSMVLGKKGDKGGKIELKDEEKLTERGKGLRDLIGKKVNIQASLKTVDVIESSEGQAAAQSKLDRIGLK